MLSHSFDRALRSSAAVLVLVGVMVASLAAQETRPSSAGPGLATATLVRPPPSWAVTEIPATYEPFVGKNGLPDPYPQREEPIGLGTECVDFWQANHFVVYRPETAKSLYTQYTPTTVDYHRGTLPAFERIVDRHLLGMACDRDKAVLLVREVMPKLMKHPGMAPLGLETPPGRGLLDEPLLASGQGYCNEQARLFVRLCQVAGIPARLIFLFYSNLKSGHVVAEFYAEGRWSMADASYFCVFPAAGKLPGEASHLMSAAECHGEGKLQAARTYHRRIQELLAMSDEELVGAKFADILDPAERAREIARTAGDVLRMLGPRTPESIAKEWWAFGVLNYPLPPPPR